MGQTVKSSTELLEYKQAKAPADILTVPIGYVKEKRDMSGGRKQPPAGRGMPKMPKGLFGKGASADNDQEEMNVPSEAEEEVDLKSLLNVFK